MAPDRAIARRKPPLSDAGTAGGPAHAGPIHDGLDQIPPPLRELHKQTAAEAAARIVKDGMRVGLGTGSTVAYLLPALARMKLRDLRCAATSPATAQAAQMLGLIVEDLDTIGELDIAIDGADQVDPSGWLVKGGGAAQTREKIVAAASRQFVVIVSADKLLPALTPPVPLEVLRFGARRTLAEVGDARLRGELESPDGNLIADYLGPVGADPTDLAARLSATPGVVEHGLFAPHMVSYILIAGADGVERRVGGKPEMGGNSPGL
jgi:ribose 5-phosphate isomerase A